MTNLSPQSRLEKQYPKAIISGNPTVLPNKSSVVGAILGSDLDVLVIKAEELMLSSDKEAKKALAKKIRNAVETKYNLSTRIASISPEDLKEPQRYLDIANKLMVGNKEDKKWSGENNIIENVRFLTPLVSKEYPFIRINGFIAGSNFLCLNGEPTRRINGVVIIFNVDKGDERSKGLRTTCRPIDTDVKGLRLQSFRKSERYLKYKLFGELSLDVDEMTYTVFEKGNLGPNYIWFDFSPGVTLQKDLQTGEGEEEMLTFEKGIIANLDGIAGAINDTYYEAFNKVGRVGNGDKRFSR